MDMSFKTSLVALGMDVDATVSPHFGVGGSLHTIPIEQSGRYREDLTSTTLTPGQTQWVIGTPEGFLGTVRREGSPLLPAEALGYHPAVLAPQVCFLVVLRGFPQKMWVDIVIDVGHPSTGDLVSPSDCMYMGVPPIYSEHPTNIHSSPAENLVQGSVT